MAEDGAFVLEICGHQLAPIYRDGDRIVYLADTSDLDTDYATAKANAAFIVKAVNAHDELVAIAARYISLIRSDYEGRNGTFGSMQEQYDHAYAVLEKAK